MDRLENKVALVTGAGTGIGQATALRMAQEGARVVVSDIDEAAAAATAASLGPEALAMAHDVSVERDWQRVMARITQLHGRLDILVNNAGILAIGDAQDVESTDLAHWRAIQTVNVDGVFLGCQAGVTAMKAGGGGAIVNLSSIAGLLGTPHLFAYGASKGAVRQLTKSVATYCGRKGYNIRCNSVHPGVIETRMGNELFALGGGDIPAGKAARAAQIPLGRLGEAVDVANCIVFLASDEARYVTGAELVVDGGYTVL